MYACMKEGRKRRGRQRRKGKGEDEM